MPKEAVVVILDANPSMAARVDSSPKTRFECAKEACIAIISDLMIRSKTNEVTVVVLHTETTNNHFYDEEDENDETDCDESSSSPPAKHCPFPNITEFSGNGEVTGIRQPLPDLLRTIHGLQPSKQHSKNNNNNNNSGDFETGLVYAADALYRRTAGKKFERRIVLVTDAEHRVGNTPEGHQKLLVALEGLRAMECSIQVVGMDFETGADFDVPLQNPSELASQQNDDEDDDDDKEEDEDDGSYTDDDDEEENILDIKRANEEYLIRLAHTTGGFVYASREIKGMLEKVMGSRVVQNPTKRKLLVELAPGLVLEDARYYKLISKTPSLPLKKKLVQVNEETNEPRKNALDEEMLQDFESTVTHWNAQDENEELLWDRLSHAYRFGSDLLPFSPLDEAGLVQRSPVQLTVLGYMSSDKIPHYLRCDAPYVLSGDDSRRCCAAISALARALHRTQQVGIATFVKGVDKDPVLCGLFPLEETNLEEPLRLVIVQLPFAGDIRYPHLKDDTTIDTDEQKAADCCDELIDALLLPEDALDYKYIPDHKVRSFYKTVVKRVLDKHCDVVQTRIENGVDSMDTPESIRTNAEPAMAAFCDTFRLTKKDEDPAE